MILFKVKYVGLITTLLASVVTVKITRKHLPSCESFYFTTFRSYLAVNVSSKIKQIRDTFHYKINNINDK